MEQSGPPAWNAIDGAVGEDAVCAGVYQDLVEFIIELIYTRDGVVPFFNALEVGSWMD